MLRPILLAAASGILFPLALPNELIPFGSPFLGFVCLAPLFVAVSGCGTPGKAAAVTAVFGALSTAIANYWLMFFKDFAYLTIGSVTAAYTALYAVFGVYFWKFSRSGPFRPFLLAAFWTVYEAVKSTGYLAYPWGLIAYPVNTWLPLLQIADIGGIWPISFLMALTNALVAETVMASSEPSTGKKDYSARAWVYCCFLFVFFTGYGLVRMSGDLPVVGVLRIVLVQQDSDPWDRDGQEESLLLAQRLSRKGVDALNGGVDLVVWSESSVSRPISENRGRFLRYPTEDPFLPFVRSLGAPLLTGNPIVKDRETRRIQNGVVLIDENGEILDDYGKMHPVPMVEHVPLWNWKPVRNFFRSVIGLDSIWDLGDRYTIFTLETSGGERIRFGAPICFEDAFPYLCRRMVRLGADLLVNLTNDAWSRTDSAQIQHFVAARFRSIEMKRFLVRSTNAGLTSIIGPYGEIRASLPMFVKDFLAYELPVVREKAHTPYTLFGEVLPVLLAALLVLSLLRRKEKSDLRLSGDDRPLRE